MLLTRYEFRLERAYSQVGPPAVQSRPTTLQKAHTVAETDESGPSHIEAGLYQAQVARSLSAYPAADRPNLGRYQQVVHDLLRDPRGELGQYFICLRRRQPIV